MAVISGTTSGSIISRTFNITSEIISYSLVNNTGGSVTVSVYVGSVLIFKGVITVDSCERYLGEPIKVLQGTALTIVTSGAIYYYFSII